jgi:hypothetical protein
LGQLIVQQLGLETTTDTLSRWMAHRVAELIAAGDTDTEARKQASDLIVRLWEQRATWPHGWPPPAMARILRWLDDEPRDRHRKKLSKSPWGRRLANIEASLGQEFQTWLFLAMRDDHTISEHLLEEERDLLARIEDAVTKDEARLIRLLATHRRSNFPRFVTEVQPDTTPKEIADFARSELDDLMLERRELFDAAYEELADPTSASEGET